MTIVGESNIKFDDMIRALQDINEDMYDFIVQLNGDLIEDEFVFSVTDSPDNPFRKISKKTWIGNFDFESVGNSININREIEQNRATMAYRTGIESFGKNPAITPAVMLTLTENFFNSIDMRNVKLPTLEEIQQQRVQEMAAAIREAERQNLERGGLSGQAKTGQQPQR